MLKELLDLTPARVVAIYAHPDDPDVSSGGTMARWAHAGAEIHVVLVAQGEKGTTEQGVLPAELAARREAEVERAARVLGVASVRQLGHGDGAFENDLTLRAELVGVLRAVRPDVLLCPDPLAVFFGEHYYNHRDHRVVGFAALDAASPAAAFPLYFPERGEPWQVPVAYLSGSLEASVYVDVSDTIAQKVEAVLCHASQLGAGGEHFRPVVEGRAAETGRAIGVRYAESYRRIRFAPE